MSNREDISLRQAYRNHSRHWRQNAYCYPVVSRRSGGLSIGVNLNPDKACNFDCIYCQVDRTTPPTVRKVDLQQVRDELDGLIDTVVDGSLFEESPFASLSPESRGIRDIAFSGDGEPTTYPQFDEAVQVAAEVRQRRCDTDTKLVLITDACYLTRPRVIAGLERMDANNGEIWAKLDAGTEAYYQRVNRPNHPLAHVLDNILAAARIRPIVIQSLWMRVHGDPPPNEEIAAFTAHLNAMIANGAQFKLIQAYTIARDTTEPYATALTKDELDEVVTAIHTAVNVPVETYYG